MSANTLESIEKIQVKAVLEIAEISLPPINPKKCTTTCKCMSFREAYYCPIRIAETNLLDTGAIDSIRNGWSTREYKEDSIKRYLIWKEQNINADMPPLICNKCYSAESKGGWLYERKYPTLYICQCIETMTPE